MTILYSYQLTDYHELRGNIAQVFLEPHCLEKLDYQAGQYLEIYIEDNLFLPFSIANAPRNDNRLELHIRQVQHDQVIMKLITMIKQDKKISVRGPYGNSIYQPAQSNMPIILLAGGTGFAQAKAIIEAAIINNKVQPLHLYWGVKSAKEFYLPDLPKHWQRQLTHFHYTPVISQPDLSWHGQTGYTTTAVLQDYKQLHDKQIYISGPYDMVQSASQLLLQHGADRNFLYSDMLRNVHEIT